MVGTGTCLITDYYLLLVLFSRAKEGNLRLGGVVIVSLKSLEDVDRLALAHFMVGSCLVL